MGRSAFPAGRRWVYCRAVELIGRLIRNACGINTDGKSRFFDNGDHHPLLH